MLDTEAPSQMFMKEQMDPISLLPLILTLLVSLILDHDFLCGRRKS